MILADIARFPFGLPFIRTPHCWFKVGLILMGFTLLPQAGFGIDNQCYTEDGEIVFFLQGGAVKISSGSYLANKNSKIQSCRDLEKSLRKFDTTLVNLQVGFEKNYLDLISKENRAVKDQNVDTTLNTGWLLGDNLRYSTAIKVLSPFFIFVAEEVHPSLPSQLALAFRFSGAQKKLNGRWFDLEKADEKETYFYFNSNQIAGEILFGIIDPLAPSVTIGLRGGYQFYDLVVSHKTQGRLIYDVNQSSPFLSLVAHFNVTKILTESISGEWNPFLSLIFSMERTVMNQIQTTNINNRDSDSWVEMRMTVYTFATSWLF